MTELAITPAGDDNADAASAAARAKPMSPNQRAWARFKRNRIGTLSGFDSGWHNAD